MTTLHWQYDLAGVLVSNGGDKLLGELSLLRTGTRARPAGYKVTSGEGFALEEVDPRQPAVAVVHLSHWRGLKQSPSLRACSLVVFLDATDPPKPAVVDPTHLGDKASLAPEGRCWVIKTESLAENFEWFRNYLETHEPEDWKPEDWLPPSWHRLAVLTILCQGWLVAHGDLRMLALAGIPPPTRVVHCPDEAALQEWWTRGLGTENLAGFVLDVLRDIDPIKHAREGEGDLAELRTELDRLFPPPAAESLSPHRPKPEPTRAAPPLLDPRAISADDVIGVYRICQKLLDGNRTADASTTTP